VVVVILAWQWKLKQQHQGRLLFMLSVAVCVWYSIYNRKGDWIGVVSNNCVGDGES
jgi:hypothetical protein